MARFDVFNGDADGICALHQLRLAMPAEAELVTGVKRDINLLRRVEPAEGDEVTVLDISLDKNRDDLQRILDAGAFVRYFDHHYAGDLPEHERLVAAIDPAPDVCTALLVDGALGGAHRAWAVVGAFGDNLDDSARRAAEPLDLSEERLAQLRHLGILLNYNGYGAALEDLFFEPDELYLRVQPYPDPFAFILEEPAFEYLEQGYAEDMERTEALKPESEGPHHALYLLPDAPWARRVGGVLANDLANQAPERAHAMLSAMPGGGYRVSVRAPLANKQGADALCRQFPSGGGRAAAAGINELPADQLEAFEKAFREAFSGS